MKLEFRTPRDHYTMDADYILSNSEIENPVANKQNIIRKIAEFTELDVSVFKKHKLRVSGNYIVVSDQI